MMRGKWLWVTVLAAAMSGCGEGRLIFNVDIQSFLAGTGTDTLRIPPDPLPPMPPSTSVTAATPPVGVDLPSGMSSSNVDTVRLTGNVDVTNPTSSGTLSYEIFFASVPDSATVYGGTPALIVGPSSFPAGSTTSIPISAPNLAAPIRDVFKGSGVYVGVRGTISNTGATGLSTTLKLTVLQARIVFQDKVF